MPDLARLDRPRASRGSWLLPLAAVVAVVGQVLVLYWPVVTVEGPVTWTDKVVHVLVFAIPTYVVGWAWGRVVLSWLCSVSTPRSAS